MADTTRRRLLRAATAGLAGGVAGCGLLPGGGSDGTAPGATPTLVRRRVPTAAPAGDCEDGSDGSPPSGGTLTATPVDVGSLPRCAHVAVHPASPLTLETADTHVRRETAPALAAADAVVVDGRAYDLRFTYHDVVGDGPLVTVGEGQDAPDLGADVVRYVDLDRPAKVLASDLLRHGSTHADHHWNGDLGWARDHDYLAYGGRYYEVTVRRTTGDTFDHAYYRFRPLRPAPDGDPVVVAFRTPTDAVRRTLDAAVETGSVSGEPVDDAVRRFVGRFTALARWETVYRLRVE